MLGASQWRTGVKSTPVDIKNRKGETVKVLLRSDTKYESLDYGTLAKMAEGAGLSVDQTFFENLNIFERIALKYINGRIDQNVCNEDQKEKCKLEFGDEWLKWACENCEKFGD